MSGPGREAEAQYRCLHCGYDVGAQIDANITVCPECGKRVLRSVCLVADEPLPPPRVGSWWLIVLWGISPTVAVLLSWSVESVTHSNAWAQAGAMLLCASAFTLPLWAVNFVRKVRWRAREWVIAVLAGIAVFNAVCVFVCVQVFR